MSEEIIPYQQQRIMHKRKRATEATQQPSSLQVIALTSTLNTCKDRLTDLLDELSEDELQGMSSSANFVASKINLCLKSFEDARQAKIKEGLMHAGLSYKGSDAVECKSCDNTYKLGTRFGGCQTKSSECELLCVECLCCRECDSCDVGPFCTRCVADCLSCQKVICPDCKVGTECHHAGEPFCGDCVVYSERHECNCCEDCMY